MAREDVNIRGDNQRLRFFPLGCSLIGRCKFQSVVSSSLTSGLITVSQDKGGGIYSRHYLLDT